MALKVISKISSLISNTRRSGILSYIDINNNRKCYASEAKKDDKKPCPNLKCPDPPISFWKRLLRKKKPAEKPPLKCCRIEQAKCKTDPDLKQFGGEAFRTRGEAYVIEKDSLPSYEFEVTKEDKLLQVMEAHSECKATAIDPLPNFTSVEQRLLDLNELKLHPFYRRYKNLPKKRYIFLDNVNYKTRSGPVSASEIPTQFKYNNRLLDQKNMYVEYKRVEPPRQLMTRIIEIQSNRRPTLQRARMLIDSPMTTTSKSVFDSLYQKETKF